MSGHPTIEAPAGRVQIHASCVAVAGAGILLRGPAGAGKSDLALRLVASGGTLVADDLCEIARAGDQLIADLPAAVDPAFRGRIHLRDIGCITLAYAGPTPLGLVADLRPSEPSGTKPRMGEACYLGLALPLFVLDPFQASADALLRLLAKVGPETIMRAP
jgi:HPr kinase/phosphorylase